MAISTVYGHVARALEFFNRTDVYFCIGRTSAWPVENTPPAPDVNIQDVEEPAAYKKVTEKKMVVPDEANGTIVYMGNKYREVSSGNAETEKSRWVYVSIELVGVEAPIVSFRQVGLYSRLQVKSTVPAGKVVLLPADILDTGLLEIIDNRKVTHRQEDQSERLSFIVEF